MVAAGAAGADEGRFLRAYYDASPRGQDVSRGAPPQRFSAWVELVAQARQLPRAEQLARVNAFFNENIRSGTDWELWGQADYWASPMETLMLGAGDCDDLAIAKYFTLVALGVAPGNLRLLYAFRSARGVPDVPHMVLGYYATPGDVPLVLDNAVPSIERLDQRIDLELIAAFASDAVYRFTHNQQVRLPVHRAQRWARVLTRANAEGFAVPVPPPAPPR